MNPLRKGQQLSKLIERFSPSDSCLPHAVDLAGIVASLFFRIYFPSASLVGLHFIIFCAAFGGAGIVCLHASSFKAKFVGEFKIYLGQIL